MDNKKNDSNSKSNSFVIVDLYLALAEEIIKIAFDLIKSVQVKKRLSKVSKRK
jgi:hypothetical protein